MADSNKANNSTELKGCRIEGCLTPNTRLRNGLCNSHYSRMWRYGDPNAGAASRAEIASWIEKFSKVDSDECTIWPFGRDTYGYAMLGSVRVHRVVCEQANGKPKDGAVARHTCGNGHLGCINRRHLVWGSRKDNQQDMVSHGRSLRGRRARSNVLSSDDVRRIRALDGTASHSEIAEQFGVSRSNVSAILAKKSWAWLD